MFLDARTILYKYFIKFSSKYYIYYYYRQVDFSLYLHLPIYTLASVKVGFLF
jgi:hypothetical protein